MASRSMARFKLALISKGLRLGDGTTQILQQLFQACPDFKGIKTLHSPLADPGFWFQACPDFKGIKTYHAPIALSPPLVSSLP